MESITAGELLATIRPRSARRSISELYFAVFGAVMATVCLGSAAVRLAPMMAGAGSSIVLWTMAVSTLVTSTVAWLAGPLSAPAAMASWVLATPVGRREVLAPRFIHVLLAGVVAGLAAALMLWLLLGAPSLPWMATVASTPVACVASAMMAQARPGIPAATAILPPLASGLLIAMAQPLLASLAVVLAAAAATWLAWHRLGEVDRFALVRAAGQGDSIAGSALSGDGTLLLDILAARCLVRSRRIRGHAIRGRALASVDTTRTLRRTPALVAAILLTDVLVVAAHLTGIALGAVSLVQLVALGASMGTLRTLRRVPGLRRSVALLVGWALAAPAVLTLLSMTVLVIAGVAAGAVMPLPMLAVQVLVLAAALRLSTGSTPDFSTGMILTEAGTLPLGALLTAARGWDLWAVGCVALAAGTPAAGLALTGVLALAWEMRQAFARH